MLNEKEILDKADILFSKKKYKKAIFLYSQLLSYDLTNKEYKIYCLLCDIALENEEKAQTMFDYFTVSKIENKEKAINNIENMINDYDGNVNIMSQILNEISSNDVERLDAIEYSDFLLLVKNRGSFKKAYQDIMFSTKVAITKKEDLIDFIEQLIENDFDTTAYSYLDGFIPYFTFDKDMSKLYTKLGNKNIENKS
ncbi:MAG: hypothetical protein U9Q30_02460 [Campylobacterota bacterium]|nr:hypothetical protein [Campylobacterota bacterium]